jgi:predicted ATPase
MFRGEIAEGRAHFDEAITLYDPDAHRTLATRFGEDQTVATLTLRPWTLWLLGYPDAALRDIDDALKKAREAGQVGSLMFALYWTSDPLMLCRDYSRASTFAQELYALADAKDAPFWRVNGSLYQGALLALTGDAAKAVQMITSGITAMRAIAFTFGLPRWLSYLAIAHAELDQFDDAWRCIREAISAIEATKERWFEAEANRVAGEVALETNEPNAAKAETYFQRALAVARSQQAKSWELRASLSLARLWHSQGKVQQARELLVPVYGWFTEGFDTRDLKEAKALLEELAA